jgi:hypothetical protein
MNIEQNNSFLLFIEPEDKATTPIVDKYTRKMAGALRIAEEGASGYNTKQAHFTKGSGYRGWHTCSCGHAHSSNKDYLIKTNDLRAEVKLFSDNNSFFNGDESKTESVRAVITNSLCVHYVACHRKNITEEVLSAILLLEGDEVEPTIEELAYEKPTNYVSNNLR